MNENIDIHNKKWSSSVVKYGKWYFLSSFITKGLGIILLPIYTRYLSPDQYGILNGLTSVAAFLPFVLSLSLDSAYGRFYHEDKYDYSRLQSLYSTIYWFVLLYGIFVLLLVFATSALWMKDLLEISVWPYAYMAFIPVLFNQLAFLGRSFLQQSLETRKSTTLDIISTLINAIVSMFLLVVMNLGVISRLIGIFSGSLFLFVYYYFFFKQKKLLIYTFSWDALKKSLAYSIPLLPAMGGMWISSMSDRLVIARYCSLASVGLYSLAFQLGHILYLVGDAITRVLGPIMMSGLVSDKDNSKKKIASAAYLILLIMLCANLGLFLFADEIIRIFADMKYYEAAIFIPIFGFNYVLGMQQRFPVSIISFKKKTWVISLGCILSAITNLVFNLLFVPVYGYTFAVYASVLANLFYCVWSFYWGQKLDHVDYAFRRYFIAVLLFSLLSFVIWKISTIQLDYLIMLIVKICLFVICVFSFMVLYKKSIVLDLCRKVLTR